jgi:outer membrane protein assembly factor BamB
MATAANGLVYFGSVDGSIYAASARNGAPVWNTSMRNYAVNAAPVVVNGVVYVGGAPGDFVNGNIYRGEVLALDAATGKQLWSYEFPTAGYDGAYPLIVASGIVYVETANGDIYLVNSATGFKIAQIQLSADCGTSTDPALTQVA